jgi:hypothetical protein
MVEPLRPDRRRVAFALLVTICLAVALGYAAWAVRRTRASQSPAVEATPEEAARARALLDRSPVVMVRNEITGQSWAQVALVAVSAPAVARTVVPLRCQRLHFAGGRGLCLAEAGGFGMAHDAYVFGSDFKVLYTFPLTGLPSRARVSPNGRYGATTVFVAGHSYTTAGFSTETTLFDLESGTKLGTLEAFTVWRDGERFKRVDFNFWGVTFAADGNRFYATLNTGGQTYLVEGDVAARSMRVLRSNVECPSLSPDGTRIAFKKRLDTGRLGSVTWRFYVLDVRTMAETPLAEQRSIDDQIEWLDDRLVLYGVVADVWVVPADGTGEPRRFLSRALSPTVIRTAMNTPLPGEARTLVLPATDIAVAMSAAPDPVPVGLDLTYTVTVSNHGPATATQIGLEIRLDPTATLGTVTPVSPAHAPYSCYLENGYLSCTLDRLAARETWRMQFVVRPTTVGPLRHRATVWEAQPDPVPDNDSAVVEVKVTR